jgi:hypothetical protein
MHLIRMLCYATILVSILGCLESDPQLTSWQQQQIQHAERQAAENTAAARALVAADANARQQLATLGRELQTERAEIGKQRDALEAERKHLASERLRDPIIAAAIQTLGLLTLAALPLVLAWLLLRSSPASEATTDLEELLLVALAEESSSLAPSDGPLTSLFPPASAALQNLQNVKPGQASQTTSGLTL